MDRQQKNYDQAKRNRAFSIMALRTAVSAYLGYLGGSMIYDQLAGNSGISPVLVWIAGPLFVIAGALFFGFTWKRFQNDLKDAELPEETEEQQEEPPEA